MSARRFDAQREGENIHDPSALLEEHLGARRISPAGLQDERVAVLAGLHLGDSREVSLEKRVAELFERICCEGQLGRPRGRRRLLQQMIGRLKLAAQPLGDPRTLVVGLGTQVSRELALGFAPEQGDVRRALIELGIGNGEQRE